MTFHLSPWTFAAYRLRRNETMYQIWTQSSNPRRRYCAFSVWSYDLEHCVTCCVRLWDNFHKVWPSTFTYPCLNYSIFWCWYVIHAVTLTFDPLSLEVSGTSSVTWTKSVRNLSKIEKSLAELLIILGIFSHVMSRCGLDLWPFDFEFLKHFGCHAFKLCTKSEWNRIIHRWVIDDLARFRRAILGLEHDWQTVLRGA